MSFDHLHTMEAQMGFRLGGCEYEYVDVRLIESSVGTDPARGWLDAEVRVHAGGFRAAYRASFLPDDFVRFLEGLREVWRTLIGAAVFEPLEEQLVVRVVGNGRGGIDVTGTAWDMSFHNRLRFGLSMDQTHLEASIRELESTVAHLTSWRSPTR